MLIRDAEGLGTLQLAVQWAHTQQLTISTRSWGVAYNEDEGCWVRTDVPVDPFGAAILRAQPGRPKHVGNVQEAAAALLGFPEDWVYGVLVGMNWGQEVVDVFQADSPFSRGFRVGAFLADWLMEQGLITAPLSEEGL